MGGDLMRKGTTPTHVFALGIDAELVKDLRVIYAQQGRVVVKKALADCELNGGELTVKLSQAETLKFDSHKMVDIQIRVLTKGGDALASDIIAVTVDACLDNEVIV
jgi:hypothetical protein